ncbi:hypothetical protein KCP75_05655 [Salmonella enterica subsp. enterica]|nr:hypothetical protein KCP75_05655 [Salmonella enterica subsp. enterica]
MISRIMLQKIRRSIIRRALGKCNPCRHSAVVALLKPLASRFRHCRCVTDTQGYFRMGHPSMIIHCVHFRT